MRRLLFTLLVALFSGCSPEHFVGTDISGANWGGDFTLTGHTGNAVDTRQFRGKAVVVFFGFTRCPDICTPALSKLAQTLAQLDSAADKIQVLFVTIDPQHDDAAQLARFVPAFQPGFIGLTGSNAEIAAVAKSHQIAYDISGKTVSHSDVVLVKDGQGRPRVLFRADFKPADLAHDLRLLVARQSD